MKIGIITFWESNDNYGQVLQAYALQQVLKKMGHNPFQIRYSLKASQSKREKTPFIKKIIKVLLIYPLIKSIIRRRTLRKEAILFSLIEKKNKDRKFQEFRSQYIIQGDIIYDSIEELRATPPVADCYITGSDQVWTMLISNKGNAAYFLDFGSNDTKRISYAASFGRSIYPQELIYSLKNLLSKFDAISVREIEGVRICNSIGIKTYHVLDPTLLLLKKDYLTKFNIRHNSKDNSIYVYSINVRTTKELYWKEVRNYADKNNLEITVTTSSGNIPGREIFKNVDYSYATIEEWLSRINRAQLVVTTSFHGVIFCILMHTNFVYIPLRNTRAKGNGRVESFAKTVNLSEKICYKSEDFSKIVEIKIDWDKVDKAIKKQRESSELYLINNLK